MRAHCAPLFWGALAAGVIAALVAFLLLPPHQGVRGRALAALAGFLAAFFALFVQFRLAPDDEGEPSTVRLWAAPLSLITFSLFAMALLFRFYGLRGAELWIALDLGLCAALFLGKGSLKGAERARETLHLDCAAALALIAPLALAMAGFHFSWPSEKGGFMPYLLLYLVGMAWIVPVVLRLVFSKPPSSAVLLVEMVVLSGLFAWLSRAIIGLFVLDAGLFQALVIGLGTALLLVLLARTRREQGGSPFNAVLGLVLFVGLLWTCFKAASGLGVMLGALGMLFPVGIFLASRAAAGEAESLAVMRPLLLSLAALGLWRVFLEETALVNYALDLADANVFASLAAGLVFPFFFSGGLFASILGGAALVFCVGLFAMKAGLGAFIFGVFLFYVLEAVILSQGKECRSHFPGLLMEGLLVFPLAAALWHPLVEVTYHLTRAQKSTAMTVVLVVAAVYVLVAFLASSRKTPGEAPPPLGT